MWCRPGASLAQDSASGRVRKGLAHACLLKSNFTWASLSQKVSCCSGWEKQLGACANAQLAWQSGFVNFHPERLGAMFWQNQVTLPSPVGSSRVLICQVRAQGPAE